MAGRDDGLVVGRNFKAIVSSPEYRGGGHRGIHFKRVVEVKFAQMDLDFALQDREADCPVVNLGESDVGLRPEPDNFRPDMNFGAGIGIGPEVVRGGQRIVDKGARPILITGTFQGNLAGKVIEAGDPSRGIGKNGARPSEEEEEGEQRGGYEAVHPRHSFRTVVPVPIFYSFVSFPDLSL